MTYDELFCTALLPLDCPVSKQPAGGQNETYVTFNEVLGAFSGYASNQPHRITHTVQVHVFSRRDDGTHETLMRQAIALLRESGVCVYSFGPAMYEQETGYHHIAATCEWVEKIT